FKSLLQTAINAIFLLFPFATILSKISLQALLCFLAERLHINNVFLNRLLLILLILDLDLILLPDCLIIGVNPAKEQSSEALLKRSNPPVKTINSILDFRPIPGILSTLVSKS